MVNVCECVLKNFRSFHYGFSEPHNENKSFNFINYVTICYALTFLYFNMHYFGWIIAIIMFTLFCYFGVVKIATRMFSN